MSAGIARVGLASSVGPERFRDTQTGAELVSSSRDTLAYECDGRRLTIFVEYGPGVVIVYGTRKQWDDGTPATAAQLAAAREMLDEVARVRGWRLDHARDFGAVENPRA